MVHYRRVANIKAASELREHLDSLNIDLPFDDLVQNGPDAPLAQPLTFDGLALGNRFAMLPMEGWDAAQDGRPTDLVRRRWQNFGRSGAKLMWGCEAVAVRHDGRANPNQLAINAGNVGEFVALRSLLVSTHQERFGRVDDLVIGLQLTHSGRFARPDDHRRLAPKILYHHPILDQRYSLPSDIPVLTDSEISSLIEDFVRAAVLAYSAGFDFVDIKHCHGYLGHEFLSAVDRAGSYGGSFENRTRFLRKIVAGIRAEAPGLRIGVRLSAVDWLPFHPGPDGQGEPERLQGGSYRYAFGSDSTGLGTDLTEPIAFLDLLRSLDIKLVCITVGSPYYTPHIQRPALFPPSDGYLPPEDPLVGVARQIAITAQLKERFGDLIFVGS
ncbi:MAG TPA: hypothetical protein VKQ72_20180, partial [Aggregatilineales bacterium]|nr:hypothetical protein [Aggregatilineales bacterium]